MFGRRRVSLSPVVLSRLTWSVEDRAAWDEAYRAALRIAAARVTESRDELQVRREMRDYMLYGYDVPSFSVHVDVLAGRDS